MRIAQILNNRVHYIFEANEMPNLAPDISGNPIIIIDITDNPEIKEGWVYDGLTKTFSVPTLEEDTRTAEEIQTTITIDEIQKNQIIIMQALADIYEIVEEE